MSVSSLGYSEFAFRLPSAIAASLWLFSCYQFARQQWDELTARYALLFMATTLWIGLIGRAAIADAWLNLFISLSLFDIWRYRQRQSLLLLLRIYLWLALGLLTKGPVAILIPLLTSLLAFALEGRWRLWLQAVFHPLGWLLLLSLVSPWLYLVYQDQGAAFFSGFIVEHNLQRFGQTREGHGGQIYYYVMVLPLILLPYSGLLFKLLASSKKLWQQPLERFLLLWFCVVFVLVSFSQTQLPHYVLYGCCGLILLFAHHRQMLAKGRWQLIFPLGFFALLVALPWLAEIAASHSHRAYEQQLLGRAHEVFDWRYILASVALLLTALSLSAQGTFANEHRLLLLGVLQSLFVFHVLLTSVAELQQSPVRQAALLTQSHPPEKVVRYRIKMPSFSVYRQAVTLNRPPQVGDLVFTRADRLERLKDDFQQLKFATIYQCGGIILLEATHEI